MMPFHSEHQAHAFPFEIRPGRSDSGHAWFFVAREHAEKFICSARTRLVAADSPIDVDVACG